MKTLKIKEIAVSVALALPTAAVLVYSITSKFI